MRTSCARIAGELRPASHSSLACDLRVSQTRRHRDNPPCGAGVAYQSGDCGQIQFLTSTPRARQSSPGKTKVSCGHKHHEVGSWQLMTDLIERAPGTRRSARSGPQEV